MSVTENKQIATEFLTRLSEGDVPGALTMLSEDATWWIAGKQGRVPGSGIHTKEQMAELLGRMNGQLNDGLRLTIVGMTAEDDRVAVEMKSHGELQNGRVYANEYHMRLRLRGGKIVDIREYLDTDHVMTTWAGR